MKRRTKIQKLEMIQKKLGDKCVLEHRRICKIPKNQPALCQPYRSCSIYNQYMRESK